MGKRSASGMEQHKRPWKEGDHGFIRPGRFWFVLLKKRQGKKKERPLGLSSQPSSLCSFYLLTKVRARTTLPGWIFLYLHRILPFCLLFFGCCCSLERLKYQELRYGTSLFSAAREERRRSGLKKQSWLGGERPRRPQTGRGMCGGSAEQARPQRCLCVLCHPSLHPAIAC